MTFTTYKTIGRWTIRVCAPLAVAGSLWYLRDVPQRPMAVDEAEIMQRLLEVALVNGPNVMYTGEETLTSDGAHAVSPASYDRLPIYSNSVVIGYTNAVSSPWTNTVGFHPSGWLTSNALTRLRDIALGEGSAADTDYVVFWVDPPTSGTSYGGQTSITEWCTRLSPPAGWGWYQTCGLGNRPWWVTNGIGYLDDDLGVREIDATDLIEDYRKMRFWHETTDRVPTLSNTFVIGYHYTNFTDRPNDPAIPLTTTPGVIQTPEHPLFSMHVNTNLLTDAARLMSRMIWTKHLHSSGMTDEGHLLKDWTPYTNWTRSSADFFAPCPVPLNTYTYFSGLNSLASTGRFSSAQEAWTQTLADMTTGGKGIWTTNEYDTGWRGGGLDLKATIIHTTNEWIDGVGWVECDYWHLRGGNIYGYFTFTLTPLITVALIGGDEVMERAPQSGVPPYTLYPSRQYPVPIAYDAEVILRTTNIVWNPFGNIYIRSFVPMAGVSDVQSWQSIKTFSHDGTDGGTQAYPMICLWTNKADATTYLPTTWTSQGIASNQTEYWGRGDGYFMGGGFETIDEQTMVRWKFSSNLTNSAAFPALYAPYVSGAAP